MNIACVGEGDSEYFCLPKIIGRLGHVVISNANLGGCADDWDRMFSIQILPYVQTAALKQPDKILIVVDREKRTGLLSSASPTGDYNPGTGTSASEYRRGLFDRCVR